MLQKLFFNFYFIFLLYKYINKCMSIYYIVMYNLKKSGDCLLIDFVAIMSYSKKLGLKSSGGKNV